MAILRRYTPLVEPISIDEAFLDVTGSRQLFGDGESIARHIKATIREELGLTASVGVATTKLVAKIGSDLRKPDGLVVVPPGEEAAFLAPLPTRRLPGVGPKSEERLAAAGIVTIGGLAELTDERLASLLSGKVGEELRDRARGIDRRPVDGDPGEAISMSSEETFERDVVDRQELHARLRSMADDLAAGLVRKGMTARTVTTKLRYHDFSIVTRSQSGPVGIDDAGLIGDIACALLDRALEARPDALRLVGAGVSGFERHRQLSLLEEVS
jgi:DNA polymerase IV